MTPDRRVVLGFQYKPVLIVICRSLVGRVAALCSLTWFRIGVVGSGSRLVGEKMFLRDACAASHGGHDTAHGGHDTASGRAGAGAVDACRDGLYRDRHPKCGTVMCWLLLVTQL